MPRRGVCACAPRNTLTPPRIDPPEGSPTLAGPVTPTPERRSQDRARRPQIRAHYPGTEARCCGTLPGPRTLLGAGRSMERCGRFCSCGRSGLPMSSGYHRGCSAARTRTIPPRGGPSRPPDPASRVRLGELCASGLRQAGAAASARGGPRPSIRSLRRGGLDAVARGWIVLRGRRPVVQQFPSPRSGWWCGNGASPPGRGVPARGLG